MEILLLSGNIAYSGLLINCSYCFLYPDHDITPCPTTKHITSLLSVILLIFVSPLEIWNSCELHNTGSFGRVSACDRKIVGNKFLCLVILSHNFCFRAYSPCVFVFLFSRKRQVFKVKILFSFFLTSPDFS